MDINEYVKTHGFWFASNQEQDEAAKANDNLIPLANVFQRLSLPTELVAGFYVPKHFEQINHVEELPVWVWRKCGFEFNPLKRGDFVYWEVNNCMSVLVEILGIAADKYEISAIGSGTTMWVPKDKVVRIN